ncbi:MAG: hypothetical protein ACQET7_03810 [Thermodesulfobacteriota bacterium]
MECPHCKEKLPSITCPACNEEIPGNSVYCLFCGMRLDGESEPDSFEEDTFKDDSFEDDTEGPDFDNRVLCPDGTCTGIIENGRCTECGKRFGPAGESLADTEEEVGESRD